ncbi:hypothetical protein OIV83_002051 [Microbotryomycetes sp. JL201]|nr:hypothetical protein OIV83_002051 [Microbotryomycetes sp. JL201]
MNLARRTQSALPPVYIVSAQRTPVGSFQGALAKASAVQLGVTAVKGALAKANIDPQLVEEVYFGNVLQGGVGQSPARQVALGAGCSNEAEATTINKVTKQRAAACVNNPLLTLNLHSALSSQVCASGMKATMLAAQTIQTGQRSLMVTGGMESMSNAPMYYPRTPASFGHITVIDAITKDGLEDVYSARPMGACTEETAKEHGQTREQNDKYALNSYKKAADAWAAGKFTEEISPVTLKDARKGDTVVAEDEEYKKILPNKVPSLRPVFAKDGVITAANASNLNDGASALVLASQEKVQELGLKPIARIVSFADAARDPTHFGIAPALAIPLALKRAGLEIDQIAKFEVNEAFSAVALANQKILNIPSEKLNVNGGAVALGHALGSSGSRIIVTLIHLLQKGEFGVAGVCNGGGGGSAIVVERL